MKSPLRVLNKQDELRINVAHALDADTLHEISSLPQRRSLEITRAMV